MKEISGEYAAENIIETDRGERGDEAFEESSGTNGSTICINCHDDGTYDVYPGPLKPATEQEYPDGMFGLDSIESALKSVIALKGQGHDYKSAQEEAMMKSFHGGKKEEIR